MTKREQDLVFQTIELLRKTAKSLPDFANASDWKDVDDWLFARLDWTAEDLDVLYNGHETLIYTGSTVPGFAPAGLTYEELMPFVGVPCTCRELNLPWGKPLSYRLIFLAIRCCCEVATVLSSKTTLVRPLRSL